jgi:hypothetical protein
MLSPIVYIQAIQHGSYATYLGSLYEVSSSRLNDVESRQGRRRQEIINQVTKLEELLRAFHKNIRST